MAQDAMPAEEVTSRLERDGHETRPWSGTDSESYIAMTPGKHFHENELPAGWRMVAVASDGTVHLSCD